MLGFIQASLVVASVAGLATPATAQSLNERKRFNIPAQPVGDALMLFSRQSNVQVISATGGVSGRRSAPVRGTFRADAVLNELLKGTKLQWREVGRGTVVVEPVLATTVSRTAVHAATSPGMGGGRRQSKDAQETNDPNAGSSRSDPAALASQSTEIIVTAQRRREPLREVPQSAEVLLGEQMSRAGLQSLQDIASQVPGLTVDSAGGVGQQQITLRGITTGTDVGPTVGVYVDDVPYGSGIIFSGAAQLALELGSFDVERIEILRGPQGTLYGASAFGGVMKYVLEAPSLTATEGRVQLEGSVTNGGGFNHAARGAVSLPLVPDKLAVRATFARNRSAGIINDAGTGRKNVDDSLTTVGRVSLLMSPTEKLNLRSTFLIQDINRDGTTQVDYDVETGKPTFGDLKQARLRPEPFDQKVKLFTAGGDYDFGFASLNATAGFQSIDTIYSLDFSHFVPLLGPVLELFGAPVDAIALNGTYKTEKTTLEARLVSPSNRTFEWLAGFYRTKEKSVNFQGLYGFEENEAVDFDIGRFTLPVTLEETAVYADGTYYVTPNLDATLGIRLSRNKQTFAQVGTGLLGSSNPGGKSNDTVSTYLATVRYHLPGEGIIYARAASGYRPGGPNLVAFAPGTGEIVGDPTYEPDTLWNYEVGAKLKLRPWLSLDGSLFYIDWKNIQLFKTENGLSVVGNGDDAVSKGVELAVAARPTQAWSFNGALAYTDASLKDAAPDLGGRAGERLPNVPKWSSVLSTAYDFSLTGTVNAYISAHWRYVGKREATFDASTSTSQYELPSYHAFDLRGGAKMADWNFDLYLRNVFNRRAQAAADLGATAFGFPAAVTVIQPRTFGLVVTKGFY